MLTLLSSHSRLYYLSLALLSPPLSLSSPRRRHRIRPTSSVRSSGLRPTGNSRFRMDNIVDSLTSAHQEFISAAASTLEAKENSGGQKTPATDAALENFKQRWELFRVACDQAEEFVESVKQRIGSECLVDEATGSVAPKPGQPAPSGLPPISAVRLEQMSKAVRWLVIELQQGSGLGGGTSHPNSAAPFDARFTEDAAQ
ncbi:mediator of RNA polymerase II transcription subunit 32 isoform X1 [Salvia miltiorrhiza]|uniref:mediator of RNA polymerase II transcription subunit 32 isoform X1 n=2 Tax=Salvia miltiorrhiza TaxID=226208 RepID=UPI0025AD52E1|nr:mediator of RNA polymerase II transcription subunit 32 isoform X1 [Salvia miltiorrhiza]